MPQLDPKAARPPIGTNREEEIVMEALVDFNALAADRATFAAHWDEVAQLIDPTQRNTFYFGNRNTPGEKKTHLQIDATGMMAKDRFAAICDSLLTPRNQFWHGLGPDVEYLKKDRATRLWFEQVTKLVFKYRYAPIANFASQNQMVFQSLAAYGTGCMFSDAAPGGGIRYRACPIGQMFFKEDHQGIFNGAIRWFQLNPAQCLQKFGWLPEMMQTAYERYATQVFDFIHRVVVNDDMDPERLDAKGKRFKSQYVCVSSRNLMQAEGGYRSLPYTGTRYTQAANETYGRSPAMMVLPALKTLNAEKRVFLKQGHRAADPVLLTTDDALTDPDLRPGASNKGGMSPDGKPLIGVLPSGEIQISKEMMAEEKALINDAFLVTLFQILTETPQMTATEVIERTNEKGILLAPTVGRQQSEYLGPQIDRDLDLLGTQSLLPPMPPALREAGGAYAVHYTSPLARAARAQEAAGFYRTIEGLKEIAGLTGDASVFDPFDFDASTPAIAEINGVPESWMASEEKVASKRQARQQAQQSEQQIRAAPAQAALMKAQAAQAKSGLQGQQPTGEPM